MECGDCGWGAARTMRVAMVPVVALVVLLQVPLLLGAEAGEGGARSELERYAEVPMIDLGQELEAKYEWRRKLDTSTFVWCVANSNVSDTSLQSSLDWACGTNPSQGQVNCGPINVGGACYDPNTLKHHCDWAFNAYFQRMNATPSACNFQGAAQQVTTDPSSGTCVFPGSNLTVITNGSSPPSNSPGAAPGPLFGTGSMGSLATQPVVLLRLSTAAILLMYLLT